LELKLGDSDGLVICTLAATTTPSDLWLRWTEEDAARRRRRQRCPAKSGDGDAANELWRLLDYVWTQSTLGQRPGFQCAGINPKLCTSVASKDSAARSLQLGGLPVGVMPAGVYGTGRTGFWQTACCGRAISSFGLIIAALQRQNVQRAQ
jgi:hypothetical protein